MLFRNRGNLRGQQEKLLVCKADFWGESLHGFATECGAFPQRNDDTSCQFAQQAALNIDKVRVVYLAGFAWIGKYGLENFRKDPSISWDQGLLAMVRVIDNINAIKNSHRGRMDEKIYGERAEKFREQVSNLFGSLKVNGKLIFEIFTVENGKRRENQSKSIVSLELFDKSITVKKVQDITDKQVQDMVD